MSTHTDSTMLEGKVAVITGAGRGIGRGHALAFARAGAKVVVLDVGSDTRGRGRDAGPAEEVVREITTAGGEALALAADVSVTGEVTGAVGQIVDRFGRLDILVNNAAVQRPAWTWDLSDEDFDRVVGVNVRGTFVPMRAVLPIMRQQGYGRIVNTASAGFLGVPLQAAYSASKAAVLGLTWAAALELEGSGITVNAYGPKGLTRMATAALALSEQEMRAQPIKDSPFLVFLASDHASDVNGQLFLHAQAARTDMAGRDGFAIFAKAGPVAAMTKAEGETWTPEEVRDRFQQELGIHMTPAGHLTPEQNTTYIERMVPVVEAGRL